MLSRRPCGCLLRVGLGCPTRNKLTPPNRSETRGENGGGFAPSVAKLDRQAGVVEVLGDAGIVQ
jgi:hypothetical protein